MSEGIKLLRKPRILVAPLDWGLGHATRCIPVIYELIAQNTEVWLAGEQAQKALLSREFPDLPFCELKGYRVKYGRSARGLLRTMFFQWSRLKRTIAEEHEWLIEAAKKHEFDAVISDNRFGLHHESIPSIFITHQLLIKSPFGKWSERFLQQANYDYIARFNACWIPDNDAEDDLAGDLSHPPRKPAVSITYIGPLSRMKKKGIEEKARHLFVSLSGPEPQRSILEDRLINQLSHYSGTATVVRGLPEAKTIIPSTNDIRFFNHLPTDEYAEEMEKAQYVICRSGYSTIMDLVALGKKAILVPTPGQTEQEYLGKYLYQKQIAISIEQDQFMLQEALAAAGSFSYRPFIFTSDQLRKTIASFVKSLKTSA